MQSELYIMHYNDFKQINNNQPDISTLIDYIHKQSISLTMSKFSMNLGFNAGRADAYFDGFDFVRLQ